MNSNSDFDPEDTPLIRGDERSDERTEKFMPMKRPQRWQWLGTALNVLLFCSSLVILVMSRHPFTRNAALQQTSIYSPVLDDIDVRIMPTTLNGSLWIGDNPSIWRGMPDSNETEEAWESFELIRTLVLSGDQVRKLGKDPEIVAKYDDEYWGFGDDAYVGTLDFFHQVHCLNELRKAAFRGYKGGSQPLKQRSTIWWTHLRHCTDMLMQHMLCNADAGILTYNWLENNDIPFPDMGVNRQCRDWTQLTEYRDAHAVDLDKYLAYEKPSGVKELKQSPEYWAYLEEKHAMRLSHDGHS